MKLRSIKLTNFRDLGSLVVTDVAENGPGLHGDALRYAFTGRLPDGCGSVLADGAGFACVDVGFELPDDARASVFRGVDSRGEVQASLREAAGRRVTRGLDAVQRRLCELLGGDPAERLAELWLDAPVVDDPRYAELLDLGRRLRRERATVGEQLDALLAAGEAERAAGDVRRDTAAEPVAAPRPALLPWAVAALAALLLAALVHVGTRPTAAPLGVELALGFGALAALAGSLTLTARRLLDERTGVEAGGRRDGSEDELGGEGPEPAIARVLERLEGLDETIAIFTVEAGRASRALHLPMPGRRVAEDGLRADEPLDAVLDRICELAEALHATRVG